MIAPSQRSDSAMVRLFIGRATMFRARCPAAVLPILRIRRSTAGRTLSKTCTFVGMPPAPTASIRTRFGEMSWATLEVWQLNAGQSPNGDGLLADHTDTLYTVGNATEELVSSGRYD